MAPLPWHLLPDNASVGPSGQLLIGGCDTLDLAAEFGTPLFVYDEDHLRARCREAADAVRPPRRVRVEGVPVQGDGQGRCRGGSRHRRRQWR